MKRSIVLRCVVAAGALAGVVAISACSSGVQGASAPAGAAQATTATAPTSANSATSPAAPVTAPGTGTKAPVPTTQNATTVSTAPAHIYVRTCGATVGRLPIEMTNATISCDSTEILQNAHWSTWNSSYAAGTGVLLEDDCTPDCAEGKQIPRPVSIRFDKPVHTTCGDFWGEEIYTYLGTPPAGAAYHNGKPAWVVETGPVSAYCS